MIITRADFPNYIEIASSLIDAKLNPRITEAENFDICGLMGNSFFFDMMQWVNPDGSLKADIPTPYKDLINGTTYNTTYILPGIKPVDVYFSGARLIRSLDLHITPNSMAYKRNEFSDHADGKIIGMKATEYENLAIAYWNKCVLFIEFSGKDNFPLWYGFKNCGNEESTGRQKIIGVKGRTNRGYYYGR